MEICPFPTTDTTQILTHSVVISKLDYFNSLLADLSLKTTQPLQMIQNAATQVTQRSNLSGQTVVTCFQSFFPKTYKNSTGAYVVLDLFYLFYIETSDSPHHSTHMQVQQSVSLNPISNERAKILQCYDKLSECFSQRTQLK